jgi:hypothetical protein
MFQIYLTDSYKPNIETKINPNFEKKHKNKINKI